MKNLKKGKWSNKMSGRIEMSPTPTHENEAHLLTLMITLFSMILDFVTNSKAIILCGSKALV